MMREIGEAYTNCPTGYILPYRLTKVERYLYAGNILHIRTYSNKNKQGTNTGDESEKVKIVPGSIFNQIDRRRLLMDILI